MNNSGCESSFLQKKQLPPIFSRQIVKYKPNHPITHIVTQNNTLIIAKANKHLDLVIPGRDIECIDISSLARNLSIYRIFLDTNGYHLIISLRPKDDKDGTPSELLYVSIKSKSKKPRNIIKARDHLVTAIGWNDSNFSENSTDAFIVGTTSGLIFETNFDTKEEGMFSTNVDIYWKKVWDISQCKITENRARSIEGLYFFHIVDNLESYFVLAFTATSLYKFYGTTNDNSIPMLQQVFNNFSIESVFVEYPSPTANRAIISIFLASSDGAHNFGWLIEPGLYFGAIDKGIYPYDTNKPRLKNCRLITNLLNEPVKGNVVGDPRDVILTEFHAMVAYENFVRACYLFDEKDKIVFEDSFDVSHGKLVGLCLDPVSGFCYAYSDYSVYKYNIKLEDRNVWKVYLERGEWNLARKYTIDDASKIESINLQEANALFHLKKYDESIQVYGDTSYSLEEIGAKFLGENNVDALAALLVYLKIKLSLLPRDNDTQVTILVMWIFDIYLNRLNISCHDTSNDSPYSKDHTSLVQDFIGLMKLPRVFDCISKNRRTFYDLLMERGDMKNLLRFACILEDTEMVIRCYLEKNQFESIIRVLQELSVQREYGPLYYKYGPLLMSRVPEKFVDSAISRGKYLSPEQLVPSLLIEEGQFHALRYLEFAVNNLNCKSQIVHDCVLSLYVEKRRKQEERSQSVVIDYLDKYGMKAKSVPYDIVTALRLCRDANLELETVRLMCILDQLEEAVDLALESDNLDLAKQIPVMCPPQKKRRVKQLWLKIAIYIIRHQTDGFKPILEFIATTNNHVKIEDVLPYLPDFEVIDDFKEVICDSLNAYSELTDKLRLQMNKVSSQAELIRSKMAKAKNSFIFVEADDRCLACNNFLLLGKQFHVFSCGHNIHTDCLIKRLQEVLTEEEYSQAIHLERQADEDPSAKKLLNELIAADCSFCGEFMIQTINKELISNVDFQVVS